MNTYRDASEFFLMACFQVLDKTGQQAPAIRSNSSASEDPNRVIYRGHLRKAHDGLMARWKLKTVEIRPGIMIYAKDSSDLRNRKKTKVFTFNSRTIRIRVSRKNNCVFELSNNEVKHSKRLWKASSPEECEKWMKALHTASVSSVPNSLHHEIRSCEEFQTGLRKCGSSAEFLSFLQEYLA